jgi:hypothetical protein
LYSKPQAGRTDEFVKNRPKCGPTALLSKLINIVFRDKLKPIYLDYFGNLQLPKENNHPIGENSPNLVTLASNER